MVGFAKHVHRTNYSYIRFSSFLEDDFGKGILSRCNCAAKPLYEPDNTISFSMAVCVCSRIEINQIKSYINSGITTGVESQHTYIKVAKRGRGRGRGEETTVCRQLI